MTDLEYTELLAMWGVAFAGIVRGIAVGGSPQRSASRVVVSGLDGSQWILEEIEKENLARKKRMADPLLQLQASGLQQIHPWKRTRNGSCFAAFQNRHWMLRAFVEGVPLDRQNYLGDPWRVDAMADFLLNLRQHARGGVERSGPAFSITTYAENRMVAWRKSHSRLAENLETSFCKLQKTFFPVHDRLPVAFCHGDYHPLNMVWGEGGIRSVIDWEFCGSKPELYDVALLLGCIGFDDPDHLIKEPAVRLVKTLRDAGFGAAVSWECLLELMATIRYGWMSEWLRRSDREACNMEAIYIDILVDQKEYILKHW